MSVVEELRALGGGEAPAFLRGVEQRLAATVGFAEGRAAAAAAETLGAGGKRLRPLLVYLAAPLDGRERPAVERAAAAVELVHMATLVHDDVLDRAPLRRGRRTVWAAHGPRVAAATGDYLYARAFALLAETGDERALRTLADASLDLARGEALQVEQTRRPDTPVAEYLQRCRLKTGRLFAAACRLGGSLGGLDEADVASLERFGLALGLAFQLADDVLDCDGDPEKTGKALGTDLLDGTVTLPLLLAAARDEMVARALREGVGEGGVLPVLARVAATGAAAETTAQALDFARGAERALAATSGRCDVVALGAILRRATDRAA
jgi:geranylgeranyl pyrophosphate synthase